MAEDRFRGMNTNERLFEAGLLDQWDEAVRAGDTSAMTDILVRVAITEDGAKQIVATVLANPKRYGY
jgi:hypothetical protein